jgi:DNA (cytosine-5)-methyltransferase 1
MARAMASAPLTTVSLYCGAGGLDLGFKWAGFELQWAVDCDPYAVRTYAEAVGQHVVCADVLKAAPPAHLRPDVVIGGPPCQGFSVIGRMDPLDPRSRHVSCFLDVVERFQPRAFVMENVKALATSPRWSGLRAKLEARARKLGYAVEIFVLNAADYDVPQARERMFMIGVKGAGPLKPTATTQASPRTVRAALAALPKIGQPGNDGICTARVVPAKVPVMRPTAYRGSLLFNGSGRPLFLDGPAKTLPASMGGNATPIVDQEELDRNATPWVAQYHAHLLSGGKPRKRAPKRMRRITVQEAAALQTFPSGMTFHGPQVAQYRQIGNAVPPNLALAVALSVRAALKASDCASEATPMETQPVAA